MGTLKILDDIQNALSLAQAGIAGIKGTLSALQNPQAKLKKRTTINVTPKPKARTKKKLPENPTDPMWRAKSVVEAAIEEPPHPTRKSKSSRKKYRWRL